MAFGNALGNAIVGEMRHREELNAAVDAVDAEINQMFSSVSHDPLFAKGDGAAEASALMSQIAADITEGATKPQPIQYDFKDNDSIVTFNNTDFNGPGNDSFVNYQVTRGLGIAGAGNARTSQTAANIAQKQQEYAAGAEARTRAVAANRRGLDMHYAKGNAKTRYTAAPGLLDGVDVEGYIDFEIENRRRMYDRLGLKADAEIGTMGDYALGAAEGFFDEGMKLMQQAGYGIAKSKMPELLPDPKDYSPMSHLDAPDTLMQAMGRETGRYGSYIVGAEEVAAGFFKGLGKFGQLMAKDIPVSNPKGNYVDRSYLGSSEGHQYAEDILPGGTGTAFAGHGHSTPYSGTTAVPENTYVTLPRDNIRITERTGQLIEQGDWERLANLAAVDGRIANDIEGMATYLPGATIPNYTLSAPVNPPLVIYRNSTSVDGRTELFQLLQPNMGCVQWAACTEYKAR